MEIKHFCLKMKLARRIYIITKEIENEPSVGGTPGGLLEEGHAIRSMLSRKHRPKPPGVGIRVTEIEDGFEFALRLCRCRRR